MRDTLHTETSTNCKSCFHRVGGQIKHCLRFHCKLFCLTDCHSHNVGYRVAYEHHPKYDWHKNRVTFIFVFSLVSVVCGAISSNHSWKIQSLLIDILHMMAVVIGTGPADDVCLISVHSCTPRHYMAVFWGAMSSKHFCKIKSRLMDTRSSRAC
jgi:hypothetical protein